jgi:hypothetical protein
VSGSGTGAGSGSGSGESSATSRSRCNSLGPNEVLPPVTEHGELGREDRPLRRPPRRVGGEMLGTSEIGEISRMELSRSWASSSQLVWDALRARAQAGHLPITTIIIGASRKRRELERKRKWLYRCGFGFRDSRRWASARRGPRAVGVIDSDTTQTEWGFTACDGTWRTWSRGFGLTPSASSASSGPELRDGSFEDGVVPDLG